MVFRKEVNRILLTCLAAFGGLGCAQMPLHPQTEPYEREIQAQQGAGAGAPAQQASELRIASRQTSTSAPGSSGSPAAIRAPASGSSVPATGPPAAASAVPPVVSTTSPAAFANDPSARLHALYRDAAERYAHVDSYIARLTRREQLNGKDKPEEVLLFKFRKEPWSVYFKWLGPEGKGREVVYVRGQYENKIHTLLAAGDIPLMSAGRRFAVAPDNPFVLSSSRHPIEQAGVGTLIERFGKWVDEADKGGHSLVTLKYLGPIQRPEFSGPCEAVEQTLAPGADPHLPHGGRRLWVFDPLTRFPTLLVTQDETGHEVEYYLYDRFEFPVHLDDDDFNPDKLWKPRREAIPQQ